MSRPVPLRKDFNSDDLRRLSRSSTDPKSSHGTTASIFTKGSLLASRPAYRLTMSKKPICPISHSPKHRVALS